MSFEDKLKYVPYGFKYESGMTLTLKPIEEIEAINSLLQRESPESDYAAYSWYLDADSALKLLNRELVVTICVSWHMGLPFYKLRSGDGVQERLYSIAEFYLTPKET